MDQPIKRQIVSPFLLNNDPKRRFLQSLFCQSLFCQSLFCPILKKTVKTNAVLEPVPESVEDNKKEPVQENVDDAKKEPVQENVDDAKKETE